MIALLLITFYFCRFIEHFSIFGYKVVQISAPSQSPAYLAADTIVRDLIIFWMFVTDFIVMEISSSVAIPHTIQCILNQSALPRR